MRFVSGLVILALVLLLSGCAARGLTPEQQAVRDQNSVLLEEAKAGKIKWIDYARQSNASVISAYPRASSLSAQEFFAYRVLLAQRVDAKQITPEEFDYDVKKYLADERRQALTNAAIISAATPQPVVSRPVTCITTGYVTTCN